MIVRFIIFSLSFALFSVSVWANTLNSSRGSLPMTRFNYQGYALEEEQIKAKEDDPNLIKVFTDPDLYLVINKLIDVYDPNSEQPFRIHRGSMNDLDKLLEDGYSFDLIFTGKLEDAHGLTRSLVSKVDLFAVGRLALWAPGETSRSLNVLKLQHKPIAIVNKNSAYYEAINDSLKTVELDLLVKHRLLEVSLYEDVYEKIAQKEFTSGFLPYSHLVEVGAHKRKDVLLVNDEYHAAIVHGLALTQDGQYSQPVKDFWEFILSTRGNQIIKAAGFE